MKPKILLLALGATLIAATPPSRGARGPVGAPTPDAAVQTAATPSPGDEDPERSSADGGPEDDDDDPARPAFSAEVGLRSQFVWRGLALNPGPVVQPEVSVTWQHFTLSTWANVLLGDPAAPSPLSSVVPSLSWEHRFGALSLEPGVLLYLAPWSLPTVELTGEVSYRFGRARAVAALFVDLLRAPGALYGRIGAEWDIHEGPYTVSVATFAGLGSPLFTREYAPRSDAVLVHLAPHLEVRRALGDSFWVALSCDASVILNPLLFSELSQPFLVSGGLHAGVEL